MTAAVRIILGLSLVCVALCAAERDPLSLAEQRSARKIYVVKCAKCHRFYDPQDYEAEPWTRWFESMSRESKLKPKQRELLKRYLDDYRQGRLEGLPQDKR